MRRHVLLILAFAFVAGCSSATAIESTRAPTLTPTATSAPTSTPTATSAPTSTPTAISTPTESERDYLEKANQSIASIFRNSDEVWTLVSAGAKNGLPDWASIAELVDSISTSATPMCSLNAPDTYSSLSQNLQVICSNVDELKSMVDDKLKSKPIQSVQLIPPLQAIWDSSKDFMVASSAMGVEPPRFNVTSAAPTASDTTRASATPRRPLTTTKTIPTSTKKPLPLPTFTKPVPVPTNTPRPTVTVAPPDTPTPQPAAGIGLISLTSPIGQGANATITIRTTPNANCSISVIYKSGPSNAAGLEPKTAGGDGVVSWTWKVGTRTTPGTWSIVINCTPGGRGQFPFTVQ